MWPADGTWEWVFTPLTAQADADEDLGPVGAPQKLLAADGAWQRPSAVPDRSGLSGLLTALPGMRPGQLGMAESLVVLCVMTAAR